MQPIFKLWFCLVLLAVPLDISAGVGASVNFAYQPVFHVKLERSLDFVRNNIWGVWDVDVGYNFLESRRGIFLAINRIHIVEDEHDDVGNVLPEKYIFDRVSLAVLGRKYLGGKKGRACFSVEAGPSINFRKTIGGYYMRVTQKKTKFGMIAGVGISMPRRFLHLVLRVRGFWDTEFIGFRGYGLSTSIGIGLGDF